MPTSAEFFGELEALVEALEAQPSDGPPITTKVEVDSEEQLWREQLEECIWENTGQPVLITPEESLTLFKDTSENVMGEIFFGTDELTGTTTTGIKRTDELPRNQITDGEWPKFLSGTVKQ